MDDADNSLEFDLVEKRLPFNLTLAEWELLKQQAAEENTQLINVARRALRAYLKAKGKQLPDKIFADRKPGNRLPKSDRQQTVEALAV